MRKIDYITMVLIIAVSFLTYSVAILSLKIERISRVTDPPSSFVLNNLKQQLGCAEKSGFVIRPPILRMIRLPYSTLLPPGFAYRGINVITLSQIASDEVMAHELGHIIDYQTGRRGPLFDSIRNLPEEYFADAIRDIIIQECRMHFNH